MPFPCAQPRLPGIRWPFAHAVVATAQSALSGEQLDLLARHRLVRPLLRSMVMTELSAGIAVAEEERRQAIDAFMREQQITAQEGLDTFLRLNLLRQDERARVLAGDWADALAHGPFDLIFSDCAPAKQETAHLDRLADALRPGGLLVVDNFSPPMYLPDRLHGGDAERDALFAHPRLMCSELQVTRKERVILATRRPA